MIDEYNRQRQLGVEGSRVITNRNPREISWSAGLESRLKRNQVLSYRSSAVRTAQYRPFCNQFVYFDSELNERTNQLPRMFPPGIFTNPTITVNGDKRRDSGALMVEVLADMHLNGDAQCFSLYTYEPIPEGELPMIGGGDVITDSYIRRDNITDFTLSSYRKTYKDSIISKEDIFYYVYGLLHSPTYKEQYKADLMKVLPRIPKTKDFWGFSNAGRKLASLHLNYETADPYPLDEVSDATAPGATAEAYEFYRVNKLSFGARKDRSRIIYNQRITLAGIPDEVFDYQVNGKSALEWIIDRYQVTTHKDSQIVNDPNDYCREIGNPRYIVDLIKRIVSVSLETNRIVALLPPLEITE